MKVLLFFLCFILSIGMHAQDKFSKLDAKKIIDTFFEGFHEGDTLKMKSVMGTKMITQTVFTDTEGKNHISDGNVKQLLTAIASRPETQKWDERLLDYTIQIDGTLAHVWTPYEFWFNNSFSHCGANAFTLSKTDGGWKIIHLIDSRRKKSCNH